MVNYCDGPKFCGRGCGTVVGGGSVCGDCGSVSTGGEEVVMTSPPEMVHCFPAPPLTLDFCTDLEEGGGALAGQSQRIQMVVCKS